MPPPAATGAMAAGLKDGEYGAFWSGPGSAPGVDGECGTKGVSNGPSTPGGISTGGPNGSGMPDELRSIWLAGTAGTQGRRVEGPPIPGVTGTGVGPVPGISGGPLEAGMKGAELGAPGIRGSRKVLDDCAFAA